MMQHGALLKKCLPLKSKMREAIMRSPLLMWMRPVQFCTMRCANTYSSWRLCPPAQEAGGKWCKWNVYYVGTQGRGNVRADGSLWMVIQLGGKTLSELNPHPPPPNTHTEYTRAKQQGPKKKKTVAFLPSSNLPLVEAFLFTQARGHDLPRDCSKPKWLMAAEHTLNFHTI